MPAASDQPAERIDARGDAAAGALARAAELLRTGRAVAFATECTYAIAIRLDADLARRTERELLGAGWHAATSVHPSAESALAALPVVTPAARRLCRRYLPGPLVVVARDPAATTEVAVRVPGTAIGREIVGHAREALLVLEPWSLTTVAAGARAAADPANLAEQFGQVVSLVLDTGVATIGEPPAVVRADRGEFRVLRAGLLSSVDLARTAQRRILFVCAGNTCRSPMAAALLRSALAQRLDVTWDSVADAGFVVESAGAYAAPGMPASRGARHALAGLGLDLGAHRSRPLDLELLSGQDRVYAVTRSILEDLRSVGVRGPEIRLIDPAGADVRDPFGGEDAEYEVCARQLEQMVATIADELLEE